MVVALDICIYLVEVIGLMGFLVKRGAGRSLCVVTCHWNRLLYS